MCLSGIFYDNNLLFMSMLAILLVYCLVEDIDGSDWLLVMTFTGCIEYEYVNNSDHTYIQK